MKKGKFIVFGGCEGSGKSTQIKRLKLEYPDAVFTREPGGSPYAEKIRETMLKADGSKQASGFVHLCLALASCEDALKNTVAPALAQSLNVFSDRSALLCSSAYEIFGYGRKDLVSFFEEGRDACTKIAKPDLYIIFDVDVKVGMERAKKRKLANGETNHFDERGPEFHQKVKKGYLDFAKKFPRKTKVIDANQTEDEIFNDLKKIIDPILKS